MYMTDNPGAGAHFRLLEPIRPRRAPHELPLTASQGRCCREEWWRRSGCANCPLRRSASTQNCGGGDRRRIGIVEQISKDMGMKARKPHIRARHVLPPGGLLRTGHPDWKGAPRAVSVLSESIDRTERVAAPFCCISIHAELPQVSRKLSCAQRAVAWSLARITGGMQPGQIRLAARIR